MAEFDAEKMARELVAGLIGPGDWPHEVARAAVFLTTAHAAGVERAAEIAESEVLTAPKGNSYGEGNNHACIAIAQAIRREIK